MYKTGDFVQWTTSVHGNDYQRAGEIIAIVPAGKCPNEYVPNNHILHIRGKPRNTLSFLVAIPGYKTLYWPSIELLSPLTMANWELLYSQQIYTKPRKLEGVDQGDREKIKKLCDLMGDKYYENMKMITIPAWGKRLFFKTIKDIECIYKVEEFVPVVRGKYE